MKCLLQRVRAASVRVDDHIVGEIQQGLLIFVGLERHDGETELARMAERLLGYRVFADAEGRMNLSVRDIAGEVLLVSQFTLAAYTRKGMRPGFSTAAAPDVAEPLFQAFVSMVAESGLTVETGQFGADMQVSLTNDGPVTFLLEL